MIGHHANTSAQVNEYVANGANAIEHDIHMYTKPLTFSGSDTVYIMHFAKDEFTRKYTNSDGIDAYYQNIKAKMEAGQILMLLCDVKSALVSDGPIHYSASFPDPRHYGKTMARILKRHGIPADRVVMGVDETSARHGTWAKEFMKGAHVDEKYDCLLNLYVPYTAETFSVKDQKTIDTWANKIDAVSDVGELGIDSMLSSLTTPWPNWERWIRALIDRRQKRSGALRFVYHWTVNDPVRMREAMRSNVDGIITDQAATLKSVLAEAEFSTKLRLADGNDRPVPASIRKPHSLQDPDVYVDFKNRAAFDVRFYVEWTNADGSTGNWESTKLNAGQVAKCAVPRDAKNYVVSGKWSNGSSYKDFKEGKSTVQGGSASRFECSGTLFYKWFTKL